MMDHTDLTGRVALVTGAARGLGLHIAKELAQAGMMIAGLDTRAEELAAALADLHKRYAVTTLPLPADVTSEIGVVNAVGQTVDRFGQVHALVNNAGIRMVAPVWETGTESWDKMMAANLRGLSL